MSWLPSLLRGGSAGQSLTEFAISATFLLLLLCGMAQLGVIFYGYISVETAAREGARVVAANPGDSKLFANPLAPSSHSCSGSGDPILACQAVYNSTHNGIFGGLITPANLSANLVGSTFPGGTPAHCQGNPSFSTSDGVVSVTASYNIPLFVPLLTGLFSTGGNPYRTVTTTANIRVEPCESTNGA